MTNILSTTNNVNSVVLVRAGDRCPICGARIGVYCTRLTADGRRVRYLSCRRGCGWRPAHNKIVTRSTQTSTAVAATRDD